MPLIIGFGNKARQGKDEAIKAILEHVGNTLDARAYGFGDALKREVNEAARLSGGMKQLFDVLREMHNGVEMNIPAIIAGAPPLPDWVVFDENAPMDDPLSPYGKQRTLLQWWGTEFRRAQDPDYWVKRTIERIAGENPEVALVRDVRFPNEFAAIHEADGYVVKVIRQGYVSTEPEHYSEKALDSVSLLEWDYVLSVPDNGLDLLKEEAVNAFHFLRDLSTPFRTAITTTLKMETPEGVELPGASDVTYNSVVVEPQTQKPIDHLNRDWATRFCK
jgi:hypothetical protein